jgi:hypothetical protein
MGMGRVASIVRPGEIRLDGRVERVLVAGNVMPAVGAMTPWVQVDRNLLVASHNVPVGRPAPVGYEVRVPINFRLFPLYGSELDAGEYCYAGSWDPAEGGVEYSYVYPEAGYYWPDGPYVQNWVTTRAEATAPRLSVASPVIVHGGTFDPDALYRFTSTVAKQDGTPGDGESLYDPAHSIYEYNLPHPLGMDDPAVRMTVGYGNTNGHYHIYCSQNGGPYRRCYETADASFQTIIVPSPMSTGELLPTENTLPVRRIGVGLLFGPTAEPPTDPPDEVSQVVVYRSLAQPARGPVPALGEIGMADLPLLNFFGEASGVNWIDDTGPMVGDPPPFEMGEQQ